MQKECDVMGPDKGLSFADPARLVSMAVFKVPVKECAVACCEFSFSL